MQGSFSSTRLLAGAVALALAFGALAQGDSTEQKRKELDAARAELERAARRVAELSRELGEHGHPPAPFRFEHFRAAQKPVLGVVLEADGRSGVRIAEVTPDSGAAKAGLRGGDRIVSVDGKAVAGADGEARLRHLRELLAGLEANKPVAIGYERDGKRASAQVTPQTRDPVMVMRSHRLAPDAHGDVLRLREHEGMRAHGRLAPLVAPAVRAEIMRLGPDGRCEKGGKEGEACRIKVLSEAFRWNGLNLASVDKDLGRYFGTDSGVLVLSTTADFGDLRPGDVIRKIDGKPVASPREAMDALRGKPEGATVGVEYLRDRRSATAQLKVPKAMRIPLPPRPPVPPAPPAPPSAPAAPAAPPAPPAPPAPVAHGEHTLAFAPFDVVIDLDPAEMLVHTLDIEGGEAFALLPPPDHLLLPAPLPAERHVD
ncbi:MAG TPA: PDZ domain-containing protein [Lysobacter sp.]|nr:PDZ domain-containing protein [Lysobacter sp.]